MKNKRINNVANIYRKTNEWITYVRKLVRINFRETIFRTWQIDKAARLN